MPERGEVRQVDFGAVAKVRPALVISVPFADADRALIGVIRTQPPFAARSLRSWWKHAFLARALSLFRAFRRSHPNTSCAGSAFLLRRSLRPLRRFCSVGWALPISKDEAPNLLGAAANGHRVSVST